MVVLPLRSLVSLSIFLIIIVMLVTSVLMFFKSHNTPTALLHTIVGLGLLLMLIWHVKNNVKALLQYFKLKTPGVGGKKFNLALPVASLLAVSLVVLSLTQFSPFLAFYNWGNTLRAQDNNLGQDKEEITYQVINLTQPDAHGPEFQIELKKGGYFHWPQYAIWLETLDGEFIQPLYVTEKLAKNRFVNQVERINDMVFTTHVLRDKSLDLQQIFDSKVDEASKDQRIRPESLPVFLHKLGAKTSDGLYVPTDGDLLADAFTGATMSENFDLRTQALNNLTGKVRLRFEINHSFDFNDYYSSDRFPDDPIYSGNGYSAQPSLVYEAVIDLNQLPALYSLQLVGHGHHSGQNGDVYPDTSKMTTALQLIDRIRVEVFPQPQLTASTE